MTATITPQAALIHVMVTMSAVDGQMTDAELGKIGNVIAMLPAFRDFAPDRLLPLVQECAAILQEEDGLDTVLGLVREALPEHLRETAYALAVEVAAADLKVRQEELRLLEIIRDRLDVDRLTAAAIERGARARHQTV